MSDPVETAEWVDGPGFVAWFEELLPNRGFTPQTFTRYLYKARETHRPVSVWVVDKMLTHYGHHIREVPRELWLPDHTPDRHRFDPKIRAEVVRRIKGGEHIVHLSREYGVAPETINKWRAKAA